MMLKLLGLDVTCTILSLIKSVLSINILLWRIVNIAQIICFRLCSISFSHLVWIHISALLGRINILGPYSAWQFLVLWIVLRILVVHGEAGFAQLVYQILNIALVMRLRQALINKLILLILTLWSLNSRHTTGWALILQNGCLILPIRSTAFLWIKVANVFATSREAIKVGHHLSVRLRLLLVRLRSWSTTRFKKIKLEISWE